MLIMASAAHAPWYLDSRLWVAIPVVLFIVFVLYKGALKSLGAALDERSAKIAAELEEARRLREEAQALLASYQRKQKEAQAQADDIVKQARKDAEAMAATARANLKDRLERRAAMAEAKIASAEAQALTDVKRRAADLAIEASEAIMRKTLTASDHSKLVKNGITQMDKTLG